MAGWCWGALIRTKDPPSGRGWGGLLSTHARIHNSHLPSPVGFEETLGNLGRWIDDRKEAFRNRTTASDRMRSAKESLGESMRSIKEGAAEKLERAKETHLDRDDPRTQRNLLVIGLVLVLISGIGLGIWFAPRFWGGSGLSSEEAAALEKMKKTGGADMFVTSPPPPKSNEPTKSPSGSLTAPSKPPPR